MIATPDLPTLDQRPRTVRAAMALIWWALGLHAALTLLMITSNDAVPFILILAIWAAIAIALWKRWKLARPIQSIFAASMIISVLGSYSSVHRQFSVHALIDIGFDVVRYGFNAAATVLLWTPSSSRWFRNEPR